MGQFGDQLSDMTVGWERVAALEEAAVRRLVAKELSPLVPPAGASPREIRTMLDNQADAHRHSVEPYLERAAVFRRAAELGRRGIVPRFEGGFAAAGEFNGAPAHVSLWNQGVQYQRTANVHPSELRNVMNAVLREAVGNGKPAA